MLEKLKPFYSFANEYGNLIVIRNDNGNKKYIPCTNNPLYFTFGIPAKSIDEAEQLVADGKAIKIISSEIHREFYGLDDEGLCMKMHGYDLRTKEYFYVLKQNIGLLDEKHGYDEEEFINKETIVIWMNTSDVEIGKTQDGCWCAQWSIRTAIDDYDITRVYFSRKPTKKDILTAQRLADLSYSFFLKKLKPVFECWECGRIVHWLDCEGDFDKKADNLIDSYCGC